MTTAWAPPPVRPRALADVYVVAIVFVVAWMTAASYLPKFRSAGGVPQFYQQEYGPAVMLACGRDFVSPDLRSAPALAAFLDGRIDRFDCNAVPASVQTVPLNMLQGLSRYLLLSVAAVWRIRGVITWAAIDSLLAAMFAVTVAGAYLAMRSISGMGLSLFGTILWAVSPMHLQNLPHLRDYSKAPFFVLTIVAMALAIAERKPRRLVAIGGAFGLAQGIGLGMRSDVLLNFVPFFAAVFLAGPRRLGEQLKSKLACAGAAIAVLVAVSLPVLGAYSESDGFHVALLGLTTPFDRALHVRSAPYDFGYVYSDSYMSSVVQSRWSRLHPGDRQVDPGNVPEGPASRAYYAALAATFPGDFATRMIGSTLSALNLPFSISYGYFPLGVSSPLLMQLETWRARVMLLLFGTGPMVAGALLVGIGMTRLRDGAVAFALLLFWAAYPVIQFHGRHVFHLELLVIAMFVWLISMTWRTARSRSLSPPPLRLAWRSAALAAVLCAAVAVALVAARRVQTPRVRALLASYEHASTEPVLATPMPLADGQMRLLMSVFDQAGQPPRLRHAMLVVDFPEVPPVRDCGSSAVDVTFRYRRAGVVSSELDFSRTVTVPATGSGHQPARVFFPAYGFGEGDPPPAGLIGIDLPAAKAECARIARIRDTRALPLLLDATLAEGWEHRPLYQRVDLGPLVPERIWFRLVRWWPALAALG